ncbi:MAG: ribbon-helix-helix domain-containing protein [Oscillospiraceae bacterium]|nr:ribbon-helix-helix domain-containing protein [Oscillospiraceae bacterium]
MPKFIAHKPEKEVISMRIPVDTLREVDKKAADAEISRNEFLVQAIRFALSNMEEQDEETD